MKGSSGSGCSRRLQALPEMNGDDELAAWASLSQAQVSLLSSPAGVVSGLDSSATVEVACFRQGSRQSRGDHHQDSGSSSENEVPCTQDIDRASHGDHHAQRAGDVRPLEGGRAGEIGGVRRCERPEGACPALALPSGSRPAHSPTRRWPFLAGFGLTGYVMLKVAMGSSGAPRPVPQPAVGAPLPADAGAVACVLQRRTSRPPRWSTPATRYSLRCTLALASSPARRTPGRLCCS